MSSMGRRDSAAAFLTRPVIRSVARRAPRWKGVLTFNYHRIGDPATQPWDRTLWNATGEELDAQLAVLAREADVIGPEDVARLQRAGTAGRHVLVTFDDGYRDNYELAYPLLRRHGVHASFFLATGFLDRPHVAWWDEVAWMVRHAGGATLDARPWLPDPLPLESVEQDRTIAAIVGVYKGLPADEGERLLDRVAEAGGSGRCGPEHADGLWMTWDMARELRDAGMTIGGHTVEHPILARVPLERQRAEIDGCAQRLEAELGQPMRWFAYPVGSQDAFTSETQALLRERGVELGFSFYGGLGRYDAWNPYDVPRVHVGRGYGPPLVHAAVWLPQLFARW